VTVHFNIYPASGRLKKYFISSFKHFSPVLIIIRRIFTGKIGNRQVTGDETSKAINKVSIS